jgi:hypothetical protein
MSCLFDSLNFFIKLDSFTIRNIICNYLEGNNKIIDGLETDFILSLDIPKDEYIRRMRHPYTWGGGIEIQAACNIWNAKILVNNMTNGNNTIIEFLPTNNTYNHTIELIWTGAHYEPKKYF